VPNPTPAKLLAVFKRLLAAEEAKAVTSTSTESPIPR
jgi:hypothetical protein